MYKIFKNSLLKPALIFPHIKDPLKKAWAFFFLMLTIVMIPVIILLVMNQSMLSTDQKIFENLYREGLADNYYIIDSKLEYEVNNVGKNGLITENYAVIIGEYTIDATQTFQVPFIFRLKEEGIEFSILSIRSSFYTYEQLGIVNLDLSNTSSSSHLLNALNKIVSENIVVHHVAVFIILFFGYFVSMLFIVLLLSAFVFKPIPFKLKFKLNMFLVAPLALMQFLGSLYGFSEELFIVGVIWTSFNSIRLFRNIDLIRK